MAILGDPIADIVLNPRKQAHLAKGEPLLVVTRGEPATITLVRQCDAGSGSAGLLMGRVRQDYVWGLEKGTVLPPLSEWAVASATGVPLYHSVDGSSLGAGLNGGAINARTRIQIRGESWLVAQWPLFLKPKFGIDSWSLVVLQPEAHVLAPIARFKFIFVLVVVLALLMVTVLSLHTLRRSLDPIDALKNGARRIAAKDFDHRVAVSSGDEFQELADSFNAMSDQLGSQFQFLAMQTEVNLATLSGKAFEPITELSITRLLTDFQFRRIGICRVNTDAPDEGKIFTGYAKTPDRIIRQPFHVLGKHLNRFRSDQPWVALDDPAELSHYLSPDSFSATDAAIFFPIYIKQRLFALLFVMGHPGEHPTEGSLSLVRQFADQLAVAWSNINMVQDLRRLTIGAMQALARAGDAKSPWTAGHSARVMRVAVGIGRHMGLPVERVERLEQAALLHDIGKIGISSKILDKPGKLTDAEFDTLKSHPIIGNKILGPIPVFEAIIPMVRQHHERWDGKGYPDGLAGDAITLEARILAVADAYDAMVSDRPYRQSMDSARVITILKAEAGRQLDPTVVAAFLAVMSQKTALAA